MRWRNLVQNNHQNIDLLSYIYDTYKSAHKILCWDRRNREYLYVNFFTQLAFSSLNDKLFETSQGYREHCPSLRLPRSLISRKSQ